MKKKILLYNTLSRTKESFSPIHRDEVRMYSCGPTVNNYAHIGNLRAYVVADILQKTLEYFGYSVKRVMNITDIGILSSDGDVGEDKMTAALVREKKKLTLENMRELAELYTEKFKDDLNKLNIKIPSEIYFASDYVKEDIELVQRLEKKGYTYKTRDGIYFDTSKMPDYGVLWGVKKNKDESQSRIAENPEKKNPEDFALWKFNSKIGFESQWGLGFPGWHIECSAIGMKFLGEQFDIHTGGIDLIPTHHTNEIAQSECATDKKPFVKFWMHSEFVDMASEKMAKSKGNFLKLDDLTTRNIDPITYRFWLLMAHYRTKVNFNWEALGGAETALRRLYNLYIELGTDIGKINHDYNNKFKNFIEDDLDTSRALVLLWDIFKDENISNVDKKATILDFDKVLGLGFGNLRPRKVYKLNAETGKFTVKGEDVEPIHVEKENKKLKKLEALARKREEEKRNKNWDKADEIRGATAGLGYGTEDTSSGPEFFEI